MGVGSTELVIVSSLIYFVLILVPVSKIMRKAGYSGWWSVCALIPLVNLIMLWVFAYAKWPQVAHTEP